MKSLPVAKPRISCMVKGDHTYMSPCDTLPLILSTVANYIVYLSRTLYSIEHSEGFSYAQRLQVGLKHHEGRSQ